jgi:hypothetical protein
MINGLSASAGLVPVRDAGCAIPRQIVVPAQAGMTVKAMAPNEEGRFRFRWNDGRLGPGKPR